MESVSVSESDSASVNKPLLSYKCSGKTPSWAHLKLWERISQTNFLLSQVLNDWNKGELDSFLIEISRDIFKFKDTDGKHLVDKIRDAAGQVCLKYSRDHFYWNLSLVHRDR